jgi:hypothetical protein
MKPLSYNISYACLVDAADARLLMVQLGKVVPSRRLLSSILVLSHGQDN